MSGLAAGTAAPILSARACAAVAREMLIGGEDIDPIALAPIYPREPEAVRLWASRSPITARDPAPGRSNNRLSSATSRNSASGTADRWLHEDPQDLIGHAITRTRRPS